MSITGETGWQARVAEEGFAVVEGAVTAERAESVLKRLLECELRWSRAGARHVLQQKCVAEIAESEEMMRLAEGVLGDGAVAFRATLFGKSAESNWLVGWHQDTALPLREKTEREGWGPWSVKDGLHYAHAPVEALERVVALRLALDDSTEANGPLRVLPGTQGMGVMTDEAILELAKRIESVSCPVGLGGVVAMRPLAVHASSKSASDAPRRVLHIEYAESLEIAEGMTLVRA